LFEEYKQSESDHEHHDSIIEEEKRDYYSELKSLESSDNSGDEIIKLDHNHKHKKRIKVKSFHSEDEAHHSSSDMDSSSESDTV
jgi:hypothetical protein